jgi:hypothetical protein
LARYEASVCRPQRGDWITHHRHPTVDATTTTTKTATTTTTTAAAAAAAANP